MAVKVTNITDIDNLGSKMSSYSSSIKGATGSAQTSFNGKIEGSKADAINQYIEVMNELSSAVFTEFPDLVQQFGAACSKYAAALQGEGFNNKIRSTKAEVNDHYCLTYETKQVSKTTEQASAVKSMINKIAGIVDTVESSKIDPAEFETKIKSKTTKIKQTRSNVEQDKKAFIATLTSIESGLTNCLQAINRVTTLADPTSGLNAATMINLISKGLLTKENMTSVLEKSNKTDRKALGYLADSNYEQLFELDPNKLSDSTYGLMIEHVANNKEHPKEVEKLVNGLFGQTSKGAEERVKTYLEKFSQQTLLQTTQMSMILAVDDSDAALLVRYNSMRQLDSFFETLYVLNPVKSGASWKPSDEQKKYGVTGISTNYYGKITGLSFGSNGITFDLKKYTSVAGITAKESSAIESIRYDGKYEFKEAEENKRLNDIREEKNAYLLKVMGSGLMTTVGIFAPELSLAIGIVTAIGNSGKNSEKLKTATDIGKFYEKGILEYQKGKYGNDKAGFEDWKKGYDSKNSAIGGIGSYMSTITELTEGWDKLNQEEQKAKLDRLNSILDVGGLAIKDGGDMVYAQATAIEKMNYEQQQRLLALTNNGYESFFKSLSEKDAKVIREQLDENNPVDNFILHGGDPFDDKVKLDQVEDRLQEAIGAVFKGEKDKIDSYVSQSDNWFKEDGGFVGGQK